MNKPKGVGIGDTSQLLSDSPNRPKGDVEADYVSFITDVELMNFNQTNPVVPEWAETMWRFLRRDMPTTEFEQWVHITSYLEPLMSPRLYWRILDTNYRDRMEVEALSKDLRAWLESEYPRSCSCLTWMDTQTFPMGGDTTIDHAIEQFEEIKARTPWIDLVRCKECGQAWYLAKDTREDDYHLRRLTESEVQAIGSGIWPTTFDHMEALWPSPEWLSQSGFTSLEEWQRMQND